MNTNNDLLRDLARAYEATPEHLRSLQARLAAAAQEEGILDVAYRTVDSPSACCCSPQPKRDSCAWRMPARTTTRFCSPCRTASARAS
jgi:hypothetical protein